MVTKRELLLIGIPSAIILGLIAVTTFLKKGLSKYTIQATQGGTTTPVPYAVGTWYIDGVPKQNGGKYFTVLMDADHTVTCEFKFIA